MQDERLVVGFDSSDDAAVYLVRDDLAAIHTVDFFPPIVDDPYAFGQIAAANSLSDVYAMGGTPNLAMNLICFPSCLDLQTVRAILEGGADKVREAGAVIAGGHSIEDSEPKYGLCVTGYAHPDDILRNDRARPGDKLVLTKPLGTGILTTAAMAELLGEQQVRDMTAVMATLNKNAQRAMMPVRPSACTDVTGFGFLATFASWRAAAAFQSSSTPKACPYCPVCSSWQAKASFRREPTATWTLSQTRFWSTRRSRRRSLTCFTTRRRRADCSSRCPKRAPAS